MTGDRVVSPSPQQEQWLFMSVVPETFPIPAAKLEEQGEHVPSP